MQLFKIIRLKLGGKFYEELAHEMGYCHLDKAVERIKSLETTQSTYAWLKKGDGFDMKYSNEEFLIVICELLAIKFSSYDAPIQEAKKRLSDLENMRGPYIFIDTGFKRKGETLISLAALQHRRFLKFDKEVFLYTPEKEFLEIVSSRIKEHYAQSGGKLELWGKIQKYIFHDKYGIAHTFDTKGVKFSEKYNSLFGYLKRYEQEYDKRLFERDKYKLVSMIMEDVSKKILQKNSNQSYRLIELNLSIFNMQNIGNFLINAVKKAQKTDAFFLIDNYDTIVYMTYHDSQVYMQYQEICAYDIKCLAEKNGFHKAIYDFLYRVEKENPLEQGTWSQIQVTDINKTAYEIEKSYVDLIHFNLISQVKNHKKERESSYFCNNKECRGIISVCNMLEEFYKDNFITKEKLVDLLIEFGKLSFRLHYVQRVEYIVRRIYILTKDINLKLQSKSDIWEMLKTV